MYLNKVIIIGNLTRDPELKSLPSGIQVANIGVATNRVWKDKDGNKQENTEFHNVVIFGRQAETTSQYLKKGSSVLIEGRLQTRSWEDKETGKKLYRTEVIAEAVQFGPRKDGSVGGGNTQQTQQQAPAKEIETIEYPEEEINPEDIPF
ncbi:TPA: single-stranded DNA-binding protein [Candidatus Campbellbacteria bacterium]|jgi:single-strand DNA-binding protein|nr:MAG: single-strand binding protein, single-strand DNA-binding protein [Candidatus Campbellbacteria bacterium GW2011_OD1_34_28]KKP75191.1 MAG: Single-stranded DNA-binding protein [Candidatus Campbellbacteria bacterium GW2011_GWD2_35_24]KKP76248.1 MAG: single-strand binding protein, single-strand DNA-binding protein [Candidatus Campbellbacteria bacterium GW2011_GWC2_35_28]KKP77437.1 MAG: Single-stranded DNA-binding protein [Candidatus Campbellbacteria bacterium GW2011_GWC1_35_31]KKP79366.1 MAG